MSDLSSNNKRIVKNTFLLYVRMLLLMIISLYTSRVNLHSLGVNDFGIYNVVGGIVAMFSILSGTLSAAISRFITYELGSGNQSKLNNVFSSSLTIQVGLSFVIVVIAETLGLWFLNNELVIPTDRIIAANWVYQFSIATFCVNLLSIPYNASIVSHEKMSAFAFISILEGLFALFIAYSTSIAPIDKLIFFAGMYFLVSLLIRSIYVIYCKRNFEECNYHFVYDVDILKKMFGFAGWNFIGASSAVLRGQGGNILLNLFFGTTVNASRGISMQVSNAINKFVTNFMIALNPQITKNYASGNWDYMMTLIFQGARYSYYILLILALPVIINTHYIIQLWLGIVPEHTVNFIRLVLIFNLSESLASTLITAMLATGNIRNYQIVVGGWQLMNIPISYICLKLGYAAESVFIVAIVISVICEAHRIFMLRKMIDLSPRKFLTEVYLNVILVTFTSLLIPLFLKKNLAENLFSFIILCFATACCTLISIYFLGLNAKERSYVKCKVVAFKCKLFDL